MEIIIFTDNRNIDYILTTNSPVSSYGKPALRVTDNSPTDYGPSDYLDFNGLQVNAAGIVALYARLANRTQKEIDIANAFLTQWPEGPQIKRPVDAK